MFTCTLEPASKTPLCEQLYTALKREMERGGIRPGERMPSKRELAAHLSVSTATVEAAYARLISEGLCESRPRSGIYALEQMPNVGAATGEKPPVRWNFGTGAADAAHFPYATWARLMREVLSEQSATLLLSGDPQANRASPGDRGLSASHARDGCAAGCHRPRRGHGGAGFRIGCADRAGTPFCGGGPRLFACAAHSGGQRRADCADAAFRRGHRRARTYRSGAGAAYVTPTHQFPTGEEMQPASGKRCCAGRARRAVIFWRMITTVSSAFPARGAPALRAMDGGRQVVYMNTFSRTLAPVCV